MKCDHHTCEAPASAELLEDRGHPDLHRHIANYCDKHAQEHADSCTAAGHYTRTRPLAGTPDGRNAGRPTAGRAQ